MLVVKVSKLPEHSTLRARSSASLLLSLRLPLVRFQSCSSHPFGQPLRVGNGLLNSTSFARLQQPSVPLPSTITFPHSATCCPSLQPTSAIFLPIALPCAPMLAHQGINLNPLLVSVGISPPAEASSPLFTHNLYERQ